jgi:hypothetical protein
MTTWCYPVLDLADYVVWDGCGYKTLRYVFPIAICLMVDAKIPKALPTSWREAPLFSITRISLICSSVSVRRALDPRCLLAMSFILSSLVPSHKWFGLQQRRLSHEWHTSNSVGSIGPFDKRQASLWAKVTLLPSQTIPYPFLFLLFNQFQHSCCGPVATLSQKRMSRGWRVFKWLQDLQQLCQLPGRVWRGYQYSAVAGKSRPHFLQNLSIC